MPSFVYRGDEPRYYPDLGLEVAPGEIVDLPARLELDGRFETTKKAATVSPQADVTALSNPPAPPAATPEPDPAPAGDSTTDPA